jgi:hypothetical protein
MIKQENGKFVVYSESGRKFGTYDTETKAKKRLSQMEMFKHMKKTAAVPKLKNFFASEPSCVVHGAGKQCVTGKAPSFSKKAEYVFEKLSQVVLSGTSPAPPVNGKPRYDAWAVNKIKTSQGDRYYKATVPGVHDPGFGKLQAGMLAQKKFFTSKADSLPTSQYKDLYNKTIGNK